MRKRSTLVQVRRKRNRQKTILVTGSNGLIGSEAVRWFCDLGYHVVGIDNDMRAYFFGSAGSIEKNKQELISTYPNYTHVSADIRDQTMLRDLFNRYHFCLIIHAAAQPSHDWAATDPLTDFHINTVATLELLELVRQKTPEAVFIFTSSNKVYGSAVNNLPFHETDSRYDLISTDRWYYGIDESFGIDNTVHTLYGVSKMSADLLAQEYGNYFGIKTGIFRCSCITGPSQTGVELHGFLSYIVKCINTGQRYVIYGYKGKQVRDNLLAKDLVQAFHQFFLRPQIGAVYNIGGGRSLSLSVIEAIERMEHLLGKQANVHYVDSPRKGDFRWYVTDASAFQRDYPAWKKTSSVDELLRDLCRR